MTNIAPSDHDLAQCIGSAPAQNSDAALDALKQLVEEFAPPPERVHQLTQYLLHSSRDVYLGYLRPSTIQ
jgi:hypothetical protein